MKYYKVKPEYDNYMKLEIVGTTRKKVKCTGILVGNELYTENERKKLANKDLFFDVVEISKNTTYFFFGARFGTTTGSMVHYNEKGEKIC